MKAVFKQYPGTGEHILHFRGDTIEFRLVPDIPVKGKAFLRTTIGNAKARNREIINKVEREKILSAVEWCDIPMNRLDDGSYAVKLALLEVGHFEGKCCFFPEDSDEPVWPKGENVHINVEPAEYCCANSIYCAFVRQFGKNKTCPVTVGQDSERDSRVAKLDEQGYSVIPPSGTFRDLIKELDTIIDKLNCRILHLLPINPTPTTYARMGRYGSPYASLDFTGIDPGLAEFDTKATPLDQFFELVDAVHRKNAKLFLDIAINHTGWAAKIHEQHPEWLVREKDGSIHSPGAWGVVWGDLTELDHNRLELWEYLADMFLIWCARGVDGFRCDAGYMIPEPAWQYIICRVREEYPDTVFLLEGLGGDPAVTLRLLDKANMNWAYSELFQNYSREQVENYVSYSSGIGYADGLMVHYAETHDNSRLAAVSDTYAKMRTALCALLSSNGAFGFANGVEWLATEKIDVHEARGLNWGSENNQVDYIARLNTILIAHPAFHNGSTLRFVDSGSSDAVLLLRSGAGFKNHVFCLVNLSCNKSATVKWKITNMPVDADSFVNLITGRELKVRMVPGNMRSLILKPGQVLCLSPEKSDFTRIQEAEDSNVIRPDRIDLQKARAVALDLVAAVNKSHSVCGMQYKEFGLQLLEDPFEFIKSIHENGTEPGYIHWEWPRDLSRKVMIPPGHMLIITAPERFRSALVSNKGKIIKQYDSLKTRAGEHFTVFPRFETPDEHTEHKLRITVFCEEKSHRDQTDILFLAKDPEYCKTSFSSMDLRKSPKTFLAGNGRGSILRPCLNWGNLTSRYDALLLANLHPDYPVDRHIMLRRFRIWAVYHAHYQEFSIDTTESFTLSPDGNSGTWKFHLPLVNGLFTDISVTAAIVPGRNAVKFNIVRHEEAARKSHLYDDKPVRLIIRPDIEDRNFHSDTKASAGPEEYWPKLIETNEKGFVFKPDDSRKLLLSSSKGHFKRADEWIYSVFHPNEAARGLESHGDLYSPGLFEIVLSGGEQAELIGQILTPSEKDKVVFSYSLEDEKPDQTDGKGDIEYVLIKAMEEYVVKRDDLKTVIAGYPWFLDWGRDTLICARGMIAAGMIDDVKAILLQFAKFEEKGTLPNIIHGEHVGNRDTSDAPLWLFKSCDDLCRLEKSYEFLETKVRGEDTLLDVLESIASAYIQGTPNGIRVDQESCLVFSPSHFTWMDTNYPAGTPRQGYPVEIQALWFSALEFLGRVTEKVFWLDLADKARASICKYFILKDKGYLSDCLHASSFMPPADAQADDHLRPNQLFAITLGAVDDKDFAQKILEACSSLLIPGAIRSLSDKKVGFKLPVKGKNNTLLNNPEYPYWGHYEGDEDTKRKPAYHNGTAWTWPFPSYCEAYYMIYGRDGKDTAKSILSSSQLLLDEGCVAQIPEIIDGNIPHKQRGCDAQAWGITELYRIWKLLH